MQKNQENFNVSESEEKILKFWQENKIFEKTLAKTRRGKSFVFFEGPPYANGRPGIHHVLVRAFKDIILRFKTMQGFYVGRKAGWDTHGLPIEMEVEKKLGVSTKKEIEEKVGIEKFVEEARKLTLSNVGEWEKMTDRMGYWLDLKNPYATMTNSYIEALWRVFSKIAKKGYLYQDYKVLPWCPRCATSLSSHELAQGYKKVKENSIYLKFKIKQITSYQLPATSYFLVWTTTPWTLPGNVALAVNPQASYAVVEKNGEHLVLVKDRLNILGENYNILGEKIGKDLIGLEYEPLYKAADYQLPRTIPPRRDQRGKQAASYKVVGADFVSVQDGTGIVHIAPAFGADDEQVGKKNNLPALTAIGEDGRMRTPQYPWHEKYFQDANLLIAQDLKKRGLLFKEELYEHDYPFCWRCGSALIYYAKDSWFLKTTAVKERMLKENSKIGWHPEFIKKGRFGQWLGENVDWAISRERYWGTPLPIWQCPKCERREVIGSLAELDEKSPESGTEVFLMRHGQASHNVKKLFGPPTVKYDFDNHLTKKGIKQVEKTAKTLKKENIDLIISSPLNRTRQTSAIVADLLKVPIEINENIYDYDAGEFHNRSVKELEDEFPLNRRFREPFPGGESLRDVRARMMTEFKRIIKKHAGKRIIIVSHCDPLWVLNAALDGLSESEYLFSWHPKTGQAKKIKFHSWPYNREGELDLHRPYIDEIKISCKKCKGEMERIKDVGDVWFDSGAMPFAKDHRLFEKDIKLQYPADYIAEGVDQTRGWFYTLLAVSSLLKLPAPYKNVLTLGLVLDEKGEKMSKSKGNFPEPMPLFDKYGADALRWYFYTVNQPWDEKIFREADVADASRKFLNIFRNSFIYWKTYKVSEKRKAKSAKPKLLINKWLNARLNQIGFEATQNLEKFDAVGAARIIENFVIEDLSHWYIRRIRDPIRFGNRKEKEEISFVFGQALFEIVKLLAPFIPFLTERIYKDMAGKNSVHLEKWTRFLKPGKLNIQLVEEMNGARRAVSLGLEARAKAGIKVRQPLAALKIKNKKLNIKNKELTNLIKGEVNVKEIIFDSKIKDEAELDLNITPELKEEGQLNDLIRHIQEKRKKSGFEPKDKIILAFETDDSGRRFVEKYEQILKKEAGIRKIIFGNETPPAGLKTIGLKLSLNYV
ncbi:MAG: class I tRNA ligase family protein [Patescibacteria group bacterium]